MHDLVDVPKSNLRWAIELARRFVGTPAENTIVAEVRRLLSRQTPGVNTDRLVDQFIRVLREEQM